MPADAFFEEKATLTRAIREALLQWPPDGDVVEFVRHLNAVAARAAHARPD